MTTPARLLALVYLVVGTTCLAACERRARRTLVVEWQEKATNSASASDRPEQRNDSAEKLDREGVRTLRASVYGGSVITAHPLEGKYAHFTILVIPNEVQSIYNKKPLPTLRLLRSLVVGGRPRDAMIAAGYGFAAVGYWSEKASLLLIGESIAIGAAYPEEEDEFDKQHPVLDMTNREHVLKMFDKLMEEVSKGALAKPSEKR